MLIHTVWIKRVGSENDPAELVAAVDNYTMECHHDDFHNEIASQFLRELKLTPDKISKRVTILLEIDEAQVEKFFHPEKIQASVLDG